MLLSNIKAVKRILSQLIYILNKEQKRNSLFVFVSMVLGSSLELIGVSAIFPFLQTILDVDSTKSSWYVSWIYNIIPNASNNYIIVILGIFIMLIYIVKNIVALFCNYIQYWFANRFQRELATLMLESYLKRDYEFFVNTNSSIIVRGVDSDTIGVYTELVSFFELLSQIITVLMIGMYLLYTDWSIAISALILAGGCFFFTTLGFKKSIKRAGIKYWKAVGEKNKYVYQAVNGVKDITVLNRREVFLGAYKEVAKDYETANLKNSFLGTCPDRILEGVCISGFMMIICVRVAINPDVKTFLPVIGAFAVGAFRILPTIAKMSMRINNIVFNQEPLQNCYNNIREVKENSSYYNRKVGTYVDDECQGLINSGESNKNRLSFEHVLSVNNVTWKYQNADVAVLKGASLDVKKGESVALIGASGTGKTTMADVILGLFKPQAGTVELDGIDIYSRLADWSKIVGYVPQSVFLTDDTIRANVAFGLPQAMIDDGKIWESLEKAQLADFVRGLPFGLDAIVGERGVKFSGGQMQRIAIARALYEDPEILVLDEATSALDTDTETAVMEAIESLQGSKTLIIVAHRLTTIKNCDKIYEIIDGKAIERSKNDVLRGVV